jgi:hypothetical protein
MLVCLQDDVKHFSGFLARFVDQALPNNQQPGECRIDYFVEIGAVLARFEAKNSTQREQALQARKYGSGIVCVK